MKGSRSEGSRLLAKKCEAFTQAGVAARLRCSRQFVCSLVNGEKRPSAERRELAERELGIPVASWDLPPASTSTPSTSAPTGATSAPSAKTTAPARDPEAPAASLRARDLDASRGHGGAVAAAERHLRSCDEALDRFAPGASARELSALLAAKAGAIRALGSVEPTWAKIFKSREWAQIERILREVLKDLPDDVLGRLADRLDACHVESSRAGANGGRS